MSPLPLIALAVLFQDSKPAEPIAVKLEPHAPATAGQGLRWSPKAASVPLEARDGGFVGKLQIGPAGTPPFEVRLSHADRAEHIDRLDIDLDGNHAFGDAEHFTCEPKEQRGKWWSSFEVPLVIRAPAPSGGTAPASRPYPMSMWFVADPAEPEAKPALRWTRKGWHSGTATVGGKPAFVLITEMQLDGVFDQRDAWALARDEKALLGAGVSTLEKHCWLDGVAYRAVHIDPEGRELRFEAFDPGITEKQEKEKADTLKPDREAPRAAKPVAFGHDYATALESAKQAQKRMLIDFETTWCGPCKTMNEFVYTSGPVAKAAEGMVAVKVDGDESPAIRKQYGVTGYPTMVLLGADGKEIRRAVGYRSVAEMVKFLEP